MTHKKKLYFAFFIVCAAILIAAVLRELTARLQYTVVSVTPPPGSTVSVVQPISILLNKTVTDQMLEACNLEVDPPTELELFSSTNSLEIAPATLFDPATAYTLSLSCADFSILTTFTTLPLDDTPLEDIPRLQTALDYEVGLETETVYTQNPWLVEFPLISETYEAMYSEVDQVYYVVVSLPPDGSLTRADVEAQLKERLRQLEAPDLPIVFR